MAPEGGRLLMTRASPHQGPSFLNTPATGVHLTRCLVCHLITISYQDLFSPKFSRWLIPDTFIKSALEILHVCTHAIKAEAGSCCREETMRLLPPWQGLWSAMCSPEALLVLLPASLHCQCTKWHHKDTRDGRPALFLCFYPSLEDSSQTTDS